MRSASRFYFAGEYMLNVEPPCLIVDADKTRHNQQDLFRDEKNNAKFLACFFGSREAQKRIFIHSSFCSED